MSGLDEFMFALDDELRKTWYFQEVIEEARQEGTQEGREKVKQERMQKTVFELLKSGLSVEQIAGALNLPVEQVRQLAARSPN